MEKSYKSVRKKQYKECDGRKLPREKKIKGRRMERKGGKSKKGRSGMQVEKQECNFT